MCGRWFGLIWCVGLTWFGWCWLCLLDWTGLYIVIRSFRVVSFVCWSFLNLLLIHPGFLHKNSPKIWSHLSRLILWDKPSELTRLTVGWWCDAGGVGRRRTSLFSHLAHLVSRWAHSPDGWLVRSCCCAVYIHIFPLVSRLLTTS